MKEVIMKKQTNYFPKNGLLFHSKLSLILPIIICTLSLAACNRNTAETISNDDIVATSEPVPQKKTATIVASGDMLYHPHLYLSVEQPDGSYDFSKQYEYIKPLISGADLALGDFEGTIHPERKLCGYPMFNAPGDVAKTIKDTGYDVIDLAHNHILDMGLEGVFTTMDAFQQQNVDVIGVKRNKDDDILIKEVNGIKIATLAFSYGYNGMENTISKEDYNAHMEDLNPEKVKRKIEKAETLADITIVMPQIGAEYAMKPTQEQVVMYHNMVDWGADIIFGGHPHVPEPTETIEKNGETKFILYSMGNLISNQRIETLDNKWTERGVIMEVAIEKNGDKTVITTATPHPTWVSRIPQNRYNGVYPLFDYSVLLCEDYLPGGIYEGKLDQKTTNRIVTAYNEVMELLNVDDSILLPATNK